jgi:hypothetical protein
MPVPYGDNGDDEEDCPLVSNYFVAVDTGNGESRIERRSQTTKEIAEFVTEELWKGRLLRSGKYLLLYDDQSRKGKAVHIRSAAALFGMLGATARVYWRTGPSFPSKREFYEYLKCYVPSDD